MSRSQEFDYATKPVDLEHLAQSVETAVMMKRRES
jgi:DNA-binding NtrC family response regulator